VAKTKRITSKTIRESRKKDHSPKWDHTADMSANEFRRYFYSAMAWYRLEGNNKLFKPAVLAWMKNNQFTRVQIDAIKNSKDWYVSGTMGAIALCLQKGLPAQRDDFNNGLDSAEWLRNEIIETIARINAVKPDKNVEPAKATNTAVPNIQERLREVAYGMTDEIEEAIEKAIANPKSVNVKQTRFANHLRARGVKAAHARIIRELYESDLEEMQTAAKNVDPEIAEAYEGYSKTDLKKLIELFKEIVSVCYMLEQEAKATRSPRAKKAKPKDQLIANLKYAKTDEKLKLASINPADIIGAKELWVYNTKTRKLGKYVAEEYQDLSVKGTTITGFSPTASIQKTLRKPDEQLAAFKKSSKVQLRKFLDSIKSVDIKLNGRCNEFTILLKIF
jgi:hypothetical protein